MLACTPCHGLRGQGTQDDYFPRLAGKPAGYLYNQLVAFRDGRRHYSPMNYLLEYQNKDYLRAMADYFASQDPPYLPRHPGSTNGAMLAHGQSLATAGDPARGIPACAHCHNPNFTGMEPGIPPLGGTAKLQLHQCATRCLALWNPHGQSSGLHAARRGSSFGG